MQIRTRCIHFKYLRYLTFHNIYWISCIGYSIARFPTHLTFSKGHHHPMTVCINRKYFGDITNAVSLLETSGEPPFKATDASTAASQDDKHYKKVSSPPSLTYLPPTWFFLLTKSARCVVEKS